MEEKFKAWDIKNGRLFDVHGWHSDYVYESTLDGIDIGRNVLEKDQCILSQYVGINDKNKVEVYSDYILEDEKGNQFRVYSVKGGFAIKDSIWKENINDFVDSDILIIQSLADAQTIAFIEQGCEVVGYYYELIKK